MQLCQFLILAWNIYQVCVCVLPFSVCASFMSLHCQQRHVMPWALGCKLYTSPNFSRIGTIIYHPKGTTIFPKDRINILLQIL